jgi:putative phosphoesterase
MRIALISDIHGNRIALDAVLEHIKKTGIDRIFCLGDVATLGPDPIYAIEKIRELGCTCIMGNHDEFLLNPRLIDDYIDVKLIHDSVDWCREQLDHDHLQFIKTFKRSTKIHLDQGKEIFLYHGSPRSHMEDILAATPHSFLEKMLDGVRADIMAGGHTHIQMLRQFEGRLIINPGSVGYPFAAVESSESPGVMPWAEYSIVEYTNGTITNSFYRLDLDKTLLLDSLRGSGNPLAPLIAENYG